ncbi:SDR family oxidoreductase [Robiginitalea sp. SC105]|nr:SDR family oxidoreductase [Robiginitalea sp. SC105]
MFRLEGKFALVTGGAKGIGAAISEMFAARGARVCILDTDAEAGEARVQSIRNSGGIAAFHLCDQADASSVRRVVESLVRDGETPDILVNNAAVSHIGTVETTSEADMDRLLNVNIKGVYNVLHAVLPLMKERGGVVLNMASIAGTVGLRERFAYSTTKGAILTMTLSVAKDYLDYGIRCNSISPARVHTPFVDGYLKQHYPGRESEMFEKLSKTQPVGRMAKPGEIAALALYLCSDEASFITGCDYPIDGGFRTLNT